MPDIPPRSPLDALILADPAPIDERLALLLDMADAADEAARCEGHARRVAALVGLAAREMGLAPAAIDALMLAARLHDVGKLGMPLSLLDAAVSGHAPAQARLREHADRGAELVDAGGMPEAITRDIRHHHEAWDGSGYPARLSGEGIPLGARLIAAADLLDRACIAAPGRQPVRLASAVARLTAQAGRRCDPQIAGLLCVGLVPALVRPAEGRCAAAS